MDSLHGKKILVVDDDPQQRELATHIFASTGAQLYTANDGLEGLRQFFDRRPDLVILDLIMPNLDGWVVCDQIRQISNVPIIMLTVLSDEEDVVRGLESGAVDFITKPVSPKILLARARTALRRLDQSATKQLPDTYGDDHLSIDIFARRVLVEGEPVKLSTLEYKLLTYLFLNAGRVLPNEQILKHVWGEAYKGNSAYVHVYISHLRQKLEQDAKNPEYLLTEHGIGYRFEKKRS